MAFASSPRTLEGLLGLQWVFCHHGKQLAVLLCVFLLQISALISLPACATAYIQMAEPMPQSFFSLLSLQDPQAAQCMTSVISRESGLEVLRFK